LYLLSSYSQKMAKNGVKLNVPYDADDSSPGLNAASHEEEVCNERTSKNNQDLMLVSVRSRNAVSRREDETDEYGINELNAKLEWKLMISDPNLKSTLMTRLNTFRQNRELCDIVIFVREREVIAHKVVLASISPVLLDKFRDQDFYPKGTPPPTPAIPGTSGNLPFYELNFVDYEAFCALLNYAYTGKLYISNRKVADLYKTAYELEVYPVANACARYLADHLSIQSCIGIRKHANFNKDQFLVDQVDKFIVENINQIILESNEFSSLTCIKSRIILPSNELEKPDIGRDISEKALEYFSNLPWISDRNDLQIDSLAEKKHMLYLDVITNDLQDCIKLDEQSQVGACEIIKDYKKGDGVKKIGHNKAPVGIEKIEHHVNGAIPLSEHKNNAKYASNESLASVETGPSEMADEIETRLIVATETSNNFWVSLVVLFRRIAVISIQLTEDDEIIREQSRAASEANGTPIMRESISVNNSNGSISPASSEQDLSTHSNIETKQAVDLSAQHGSLLARLSLSRGISRVPLPAMGVARCSIGAVFLEGKIIICGGYDRGECLKSVEQYDVIKGEWSSLPDMISERGRFDSTVANGKIYAIAGSSGNRDLATAECFDPKKNKWSKIKNLSLARSHNGCASLDNYIYCIGGTFEGHTIRDCERYSIETEEWQKITPLQNARYQAATTNWRGYVVAIGGSDRWCVLDTVEAYDPKTETWRYLSKLKTPRRGCAVAVVRDCLYVIGGHDGNTTLNSVEILDNPNGNWRAGPPLMTPRANTHAVVTAGNVIYVIGGYNANQFLSSIELLENESVGWRNWQLEPEIAIPEDSEEDSSNAGEAYNPDNTLTSSSSVAV
jgi:influenza virus NS1A-binding protein